jgi:hypothetical protein
MHTSGMKSSATTSSSGRYVYYSTVPGDEPAGMLGTLLVK